MRLKLEREEWADVGRFCRSFKLGYCFCGMANPRLNMGVGERFKGTAE